MANVAKNYKRAGASSMTAASISHSAHNDRLMVLEWFRARKAPATGNECAMGLKMGFLTIRPRITDLFNDGYLKEVGFHSYKNERGRTITLTIWALTDKGKK